MNLKQSIKYFLYISILLIIYASIPQLVSAEETRVEGKVYMLVDGEEVLLPGVVLYKEDNPHHGDHGQIDPPHVCEREGAYWGTYAVSYVVPQGSASNYFFHRNENSLNTSHCYTDERTCIGIKSGGDPLVAGGESDTSCENTCYDSYWHCALSCGDGAPQYVLPYFPQTTYIEGQGAVTYAQYMSDNFAYLNFDANDPKGGGRWVATCTTSEHDVSCLVSPFDWNFESENFTTTTYSQGEWIRTYNNSNHGVINADFQWSFETSLSCDDLTASPSTITTGGADITLTTETSALNVAVSDYDYGADLNGESIADGSETTTWTIPSGTEAGEYHAWVSLTGGGLSSVGCSGVDDCTTGDENCQVTIRVQDQAVADFEAEKESSVVCINSNTAAQITYTITVSNVSTVSGTVLSVSDTYDSRFQRSWIDSTSIDPSPDSWEGNVLTWNNGGDGWTLAAGGELVFTYVVTVPSDYFGAYNSDGTYEAYQYENFALVRTEEEDIELETTVEISCIVETGIFDDAVRASLVALLLILAGFIWLRYEKQLIFALNVISRIWPMKLIFDRVIYSRKKEKFERTIIKRRK